MARKLAIIALVALSAALAMLPGVLAASPASSQGSTAAAPKPGDLDRTFDGDGKVITDFGRSEAAHGVAVQADGKVVAAGWTSTSDVLFAPSFALARYNSNGSLDSGFGIGGKVVTDFGGPDDVANAVAVQGDGKIVVAGWATAPGVTWDTDVALARYNRDGSLDSTFGTSGKVATNIQRIDWARALAIQADGKIVAVGSTGASASWNDPDFAVVRYNPNGSLDTSFGGAGYVITSLSTSRDIAEAVLIQPDGKIVATGAANLNRSQGPEYTALVRYNPDGSLDGSFGRDGKAEEESGSWGPSVAIQADGKLVVVYGGVARYDSNGSPDTGFGTNGKKILPDFSPRVVLVQPDRRLVVAGEFYPQNQNYPDFHVARLQPDGSIDASFGDGGQVNTDLGTNSYEDVQAAALQSNRRIVVAGRTAPDSQSPSDFALVRYLNPPPCRVPNVRGKKLAAARAAITKGNCSVGKVKRKASKKIKRGRVISQSPKAATTLPNLGKVNLVVSKGRRR